MHDDKCNEGAAVLDSPSNDLSKLINKKKKKRKERKKEMKLKSNITYRIVQMTLKKKTLSKYIWLLWRNCRIAFADKLALILLC